MNNFDRDLEFSLNFNHSNDLNWFYYEYFPDLHTIKPVENIELQKKGIDKIITLKNGKQLMI